MNRGERVKIALNRHERMILALALRELLYQCEDGAIRDLMLEYDIPQRRAPDQIQILRLLERVDTT